MRDEAARGMEPESIRHVLDLGAIIHRHARLRKDADMPGGASGRRKNLLESEFAAIEKSVRRWHRRRKSAAER